ncbi:hypothetical protein CcrKarma_gp226 [Caulobacter virus Karma]|uniref:Uncharacterized protein n=6 Tax=Viruses TaxID=10239 RepID=J3SVR0_9CAUD|nr:hypothetical protein D865_gp204 [Caulobacter phage phiCbK]YP_006988903.1 hypothetical protein CcrMagneto_gp221 [Caulobacter virus Magneto]YP_006989606.1 hypothetical protein CcrKarma_gp226 [Caulobacter virus Karma]YP_006989954.1 hypothetical protein D870_gp200 [Caulobacter phage CcrSwift]ARB13749.1 hypothetical protein Ccr10_gp219c [Caulobacter phage Ccr10]ARB14094.1 hypothetical protein Ccr2_gp218c [Caulobacter phage Ccr2]ARB14783.1 hypothetical protein Ccr29_gp227 [Caulobacter phage Ccr2
MAETETLSDAEVLGALMEGKIGMPYEVSNSRAICDYKLPAIVRGFLALNAGNATETLAIEEAGFMPKLYGRYKGKACRVIMVSSLGDVGITYHDNRYGYSDRVSIYDLDADAFSLERPADLPAPPPEPVYADHGFPLAPRPPRRKKKLIKSRP